jgi:hypothetical protein
MGATHFLTRTLDKVRTELSLHVLAYNLKRMITIFGVRPLSRTRHMVYPRLAPHACETQRLGRLR